jgi:hypothetical protein
VCQTVYLSPCCRRGTHGTDTIRLHEVHTCHPLSLSRTRRSSSMPQKTERKHRQPQKSWICSLDAATSCCCCCCCCFFFYYCRSSPVLSSLCRLISKALHHIEHSRYSGSHHYCSHSWEVAATKVHLAPSSILARQLSSSLPILSVSQFASQRRKLEANAEQLLLCSRKTIGQREFTIRFFLPIHGGDRDASRHDCVSQTQFSSSTAKWEDNLRSRKFWRAFRRLVHCRASRRSDRSLSGYFVSAFNCFATNILRRRTVDHLQT